LIRSLLTSESSVPFAFALEALPGATVLAQNLLLRPIMDDQHF